MVISEIHISRKAAKVAKIPCLPFSIPKPAAAERLPRSIIPEGINTSGCLSWIIFRPQEPSKSLSTTNTLALRSSSLILPKRLTTASPKTLRLEPHLSPEPRNL